MPSSSLLNPFDLIHLGGLLRNQPGDLLPKLSDALIQLRLLALARLSPDIEQPLLARHESRHVWVGGALGQFLGKYDAVPHRRVPPLPAPDAP